MSPALFNLLLLAAAIIIAIVVGFVGFALFFGSDRELVERVKTFAEVPDTAAAGRQPQRRSLFSRTRARLNAMLSVLDSDELSIELLSANWPLTVTEFILVRIGAVVGGFLLGWVMFGSPASGLALALMAYIIPGYLLRRSINRRRRYFEQQLVDVLILLNGAVRAGFSLLQAVEVVENEMKAPASEEFGRVRREVGLGLSLSQALENLSARMQNEDLNLVVTAININYQVGGNLSTMLEAVTETIRDRIRLFSEVRVITTQQRYTAYLLTLLPFFIAAFMIFLSPDYITSLLRPGYYCIPIGALVGIALGNITIRRIARIEV